MGQRSASVELGGRFDVLDASIEGPAEFVNQLRPALESQLSGLRVWYGRVTGIDFHLASIFLLILLALTMYLAFLFGFIESSNEPPITSRRAQVIVVTTIAGISVLPWGLSKIRDRLFPRATFAIGQGKRRHENLEKVRWGVIIAFGVSLAAGLAY